MQELQFRYQGWEDPLELEMATSSSILAWEIPWTEEPGRLQYMGLQKVRHDLVNNNNKYTSPSASVLGTSLTSQGTGLQTHHGLLGCVSIMNFTPKTTLLKPWGGGGRGDNSSW